MNRVIISGHITADPQLKQTQGSNPIDYVKFILAVRRRGKDNEADFITCQAWKRTAELISTYVKKGDKIAVEGVIRTGQYEKNGQTVYTTDVMVDSVEFQGKAEKKKDEVPEGFSQIDEGYPF